MFLETDKPKLAGVRPWLLLLLLGFTLPPAPAGDELHPRQVAAYGPVPALTVWEPGIAVGPDGPVIVFNVGPRTSPAVGYAICNPDGWTEGLIEPATRYLDPSAVWDPTAGNFLVCAMPNNGTQIVTARIPAEPHPTWTPVYEADTPVDKPWLVAGEPTSRGQEFYIAAWNTVARSYQYQRTRDGGRTWRGGRIVLHRDSGRLVSGTWCIQPTAVPAKPGPLYVAYVPENPAYGQPPETPAQCRPARVRFLRGVDIDDPDDPADGQNEFRPLSAAEQPREFGSAEPIALELVLTCGGIRNFIPLRRGVTQFGMKLDRFVPHLRADPSDPDRLYIVYHDVRRNAGRPTADVDVYLRAIIRRDGGWLLGPPRRVNQNTDTLSDQFLPAVTVDHRGRIHVIFYDDRAYSQEDGPPGPDDPDPRFDVYYALSADQGRTWQEKKLVLEPTDEPAVDLGLAPLSPGFELGEYADIAWFARPDGTTEVWTAFAGTLSTDALGSAADRSVIYSSRHVYHEPVDGWSAGRSRGARAASPGLGKPAAIGYHPRDLGLERAARGMDGLAGAAGTAQPGRR